ncbi:hypothetical protein Axy16_012 [Achromobacter phage vB_AxyS_19-32_Axy16]|nr:hypothetical protein Axy16_012 [Achromobacter phage vB_AxyS_19-32_Axy16]
MADMIWPATNPANQTLLNKQDAIDKANGNYPGGPRGVTIGGGGPATSITFADIEGTVGVDQLPVATKTTMGVVQVGEGVDVADGVISVPAA